MRTGRACAAALLLIACACANDGASPGEEAPSFVFHDDTMSPDFGAIDVVGVDDRVVAALEDAAADHPAWRHFAVFTGDAPPADAAMPAVTGAYTVTDSRVRFTPRFRPVEGQPYYVRFDAVGIARALNVVSDVASIDTVVLLPLRDAASTTRVSQVYPAVDRVPENLLRIYIEFSAPMSIGYSQEHLHLVDDTGQNVADAFLAVPQELWDPEHRRLTVLFDPGRIKRELRPHDELGLPLRPGRRYTLLIDADWKDANGRPLQSSHTSEFSVDPADREIPRTSYWRINAPAAGTRAPLTLSFPEPLDHALLERLIRVVRAGRTLAGDARAQPDGRSWRFTPADPWSDGEYDIIVHTDLEDLAGNNLRKLFDVDRNARAAAGAAGDSVRLSFTARW